MPNDPKLASLPTPAEIKAVRKQLGLTQRELASALGVVYATVNRWENAQTRPPEDLRGKLDRLLNGESATASSPIGATQAAAEPEPVQNQSSVALDFLGSAEHIAVFVEGERLTRAYQANPAFAAETSRIDPLPHQRLAVYRHMLPQPRLRFLLADDPGAGKTIMAGLYIRESLSRRTIRRILIVPPAGLVGNWQRELAGLFGLDFRILRGSAAKNVNPFKGEGSDAVIVSIDTLAGANMWGRLAEPDVEPYDLVIFDEAHKLSVSQEPDGTIRATDRYNVAAALAGIGDLPEQWALPWAAPNLLLLTATPHMGKPYPYYCLWRLLDPEVFSTEAAFNQFPRDARQNYYIRRVKEEMIDFAANAIYPRRICDTHSFDLTPGEIGEQTLYERMTAYIEFHYARASVLNRSAARFAMTVFQRRLASSTWAVLCSLKKRLDKLERLIADIRSGDFDERELIARSQKDAAKARDRLAEQAADEEGSDDTGAVEAHEIDEERALGAFVATNLAELDEERGQVADLVTLAEAVYAKGEESKFEMMYRLLASPEFAAEKVIIYTEHRDTLEFLVRKLEALGHAGQIAYIHGGLNYEERDAQVEFFRLPHGENQPGARFFVGTDAAAEGINLQFCWILVNYDVPWNPARLEQRMGRIHRYGQKKDPVSIINLVAGATREGRVVATLLRKLEEIRKELGSDKVFDVIGRIFEGMSLLDYVQKAVLSDEDADKQALALAGQLTKEQVEAIEAREQTIFGTGGEVMQQLDALREEMATEALRRVLPGYVRRYLEKALPAIGIEWSGDLDGHFQLKAARPQALMPLLPMIERYPSYMRERLTVNRPSVARDAIFLHPGEPLFDRICTSARIRCRNDAMHGGVFVDAKAGEPYLLHIARIELERAADADYPALSRPRFLEQRLIALRQTILNDIDVVPVEQFLVMKPGAKILASAIGFLPHAARFREATQEYLREKVAAGIAATHREALAESLGVSESHLRSAYHLMETELIEARQRVRQRAQQGDAKAQAEYERLKARLRALDGRRERAIGTLRREPELITARDVTILTTVLVQPSTDPEDLRRQDAEVERIAMDAAMAHERLQGAEVVDVSTADKARAAGLIDYPGFDLLSRRAAGPLAIEVKGRAETGDIELTENEWAKAATLRESYALYVVFDCLTAAPRLLRIDDPFGKLVARARGKLVISAAEISRHGVST